MTEDTQPVTLKDVIAPTLSELDKVAELTGRFEAASIEAISKARAAVDRADQDATNTAIHLASKRSNSEMRRIERERSAAIRELARNCSEAAILSLAVITSDTANPASARLQAAQAIIERAHGKAGQTYSTMEADLVGLSASEAIDKLMEEFQGGRISAEGLEPAAGVRYWTAARG